MFLLMSLSASTHPLIGVYCYFKMQKVALKCFYKIEAVC